MQIPGYELIRELGRGGMAVVYLARQENLDRLVAIKVMSSEMNALPGFKERFLREARIMADLKHPNIMTIHDIGEADGHMYFAMEYLEGNDLKDLMRQGLTMEESVRIMRQLLAALQHAHASSYIHRDIKPENVMFTPAQDAVLTDFGIARSLDVDSDLTTQGMSIGTPAYMAPELFLDEPASQASDIYALGVLFFQMLSGAKPFDAKSLPAYAHKHSAEPIPRLDGDVKVYQSIVDRMLAKQPSERYSAAADVLADLDKVDALLAEEGDLTILAETSQITTDAPATTQAGFFKRLIEARVIQTLAIYLPVGWVITEIIAAATQNFGLPYWVSGGAMALFIAGIPVVAFLAWAFQITADGIRLEVKSLKGGLAITIAVSLLLGVSAFLFQQLDTGPQPQINQAGIASYGQVSTKPVTSIAVMPFDANDGVSLGKVFAGEIRERLAKHADLYVLSSSSIQSALQASLAPVPAQEALQAEHVLTGELQREGDAWKLHVTLVDGEQSLVWQEDFLFGADAESQRGLQRRVTRKLAELLGTRTPSAEYCEPSASLTALENYHEAQVLLNLRGPENLSRAESLLKEAIELDPNYGRAYSALAITSVLQRKPGRFRLAGDLSRKALNLCPNIGAAYKIWVPSYEGITNHWIDQELQWRDALALDPNDLWMLDNYAFSTLLPLGMQEQAFAISRRAYRNNTLDPRAVVSWAWDNHSMGNNAQARRLAQQALELGDNSCNAHILLMSLATTDGEPIEKFREAYENVPDRCKQVLLRGIRDIDADVVFLARRDPAKRRELLEHLETMIDSHPNLAFTWGIDLSAIDLAYRAQEIAREQSQYLHLPAVWQNSEGAQAFRRDPRFIEMAQQLEMDAYWREFGWPSNSMCAPYGDSFVCDN